MPKNYPAENSHIIPISRHKLMACTKLFISFFKRRKNLTATKNDFDTGRYEGFFALVWKSRIPHSGKRKKGYEITS